MPVIYDISKRTIFPQKPIYLDAQVLFWTFYHRLGLKPKKPNTYQILNYPVYVQALMVHGCSLRVMTTTLSELLQLIEKTEYEIYLNLEDRPLKFKEYREIASERNAVFKTLRLICQQIESVSDIEECVVSNESMNGFVLNANLHSLDSLDYLLVEHCEKNDFAVLTDDSDFASKNPSCDVYTANKRLLNRGSKNGFQIE